MVVTNVRNFHRARRTYLDALINDSDGIIFVANGNNWRRSFIAFLPETIQKIVLDPTESARVNAMLQTTIDELKIHISEKYRKIKLGKVAKNEADL